MSSTSTERRFKVGDKVLCVRGSPFGNLHEGQEYTVQGFGTFPQTVLVGTPSDGWFTDRFVPVAFTADPVFTDGREAFKPGDRVAAKYETTPATVVSVSQDPTEMFSVTVKFDGAGENNYMAAGLTKIPAEVPAPANPYEDLGAEIGRLVQSKQISYGDSFSKSGDVLAILYPDGVKPEQYGDLLTITRILDKIFRICSRKDAFGESPYKDLAGYSLLAAVRDGGAK